MKIIRARETDIKAVAVLALKLWPEHTSKEMESVAREYILNKESAAFFGHRGRLPGRALLLWAAS